MAKTLLALPTYNLETVQPMHGFSIHLQVKPRNWWQTYFWADDIHPTPLGHTVMSKIVA